MKNIIKNIGFYGFLIWAIPFLLSIFIFPLKENHSLLFSKILTVTLTLITVYFTYQIYKTTPKPNMLESVILGFSWLFISLALDLVAFLGALGYDLKQYFLEIPLIYLIIPIITIFAGFLVSEKDLKNNQDEENVS